MEVLKHRALAPVRGWSAGSTAAIAKRSLIAGPMAGAALGGIVGLCLGVVAYLPTAPVAVVEGSILGATAGLVLSAVLFVATVTLRWARR